MTDDRKKPTGREIILLYVAHFIREGGRPGRDERQDAFGNRIVTLTSYRTQTKASVFATTQFGKHQMPSTLGRRWREIKEPPRTKLQQIGVDIRERPPRGEHESSSWNVVWDLSVDLDAFLEGIHEHKPWTEFGF